MLCILGTTTIWSFTWTLTDLTCKKTEAFEMWLYKQIPNILWTNCITDQRVLERMRKGKELLTIIKSQKFKFM